MANTILTHQMIAREAAKMLEEEAPFIANINKGRQDEFGKDTQGYTKGDTVKIKIPTAGRVHDGAVFAGGNAADDVIERSVNLTLNTQKHTALQFGAKEKLLDLTDFKERILRPQMQTLSSVIEADLIAKACAGTANQVGMSLSAANPSNGLALAQSKLNQYLAPSGDRSTLVSNLANIALSGEVSRMYNPTQSSSKAYLSGYVASAYGSDLYNHQSIAVHNNGTAATLTLSAAASGGTINVTAGTGGTLTAGTIFTIAGVNAVHPLTGLDLGVLQQFVVQETVTVGTGTVVKISPEIKATSPAKTVSAVAASGALLSIVSSNGFQNLQFHKDAFTAAFAPLPVLASCEGYTARLPSGISVRVMTFGDGNNDIERTRIDVLYGFQIVNSLHACRITQAA